MPNVRICCLVVFFIAFNLNRCRKPITSSYLEKDGWPNHGDCVKVVLNESFLCVLSMIVPCQRVAATSLPCPLCPRPRRKRAEEDTAEEDTAEEQAQAALRLRLLLLLLLHLLLLLPALVVQLVIRTSCKARQ
jgi:hypothetical protein